MKKGFTLIELIVVIAIIGVLIAVLTPTLTGYVKKARKTSANEAARVMFQYVQFANEGLGKLNIPGTQDPVSLSELSGIAGDKGDYIDVEEFVTSTEVFGKTPDNAQTQGYIDIFFANGVPKAVAWSKDASGSIIGVYPVDSVYEDTDIKWSNWDEKLKVEYKKQP